MLGCVAYTLSFYQHPFQDAQKIAIVNAHYFMPNDAGSRVSDKLKDFVRVLLVPNPTKRPTIPNILKLLETWNSIPAIKLSVSLSFSFKLFRMKLWT